MSNSPPLKKKNYIQYFFSYRPERFIELDILRGFAIIFMIFLHILWDLDYYGYYPLNTQIYQFQKIVPTLFFLLVGICLVISINKKQHLSLTEYKEYQQRLVLRGLKIFGLGMILTTISLLILPDKPIFFGVLHCIGISIILSIPFLKLKPSANILIGTGIILIGCLFSLFPIQNPTIFHLAVGFHQANVGQYTIDYFPLLPWFGICLLGLAFGNILYKDNTRRFRFPNLGRYKPVSALSWMGQHSLFVYLIHQPIIAGIIILAILH